MKEEQKCVLDNSIEGICVRKTSFAGLCDRRPEANKD